MKRPMIGLALALSGLLLAGMARWATIRMGRQPDGSFLVSTGQRVEAGSFAFDGRPIDLAMHPSGEFYAVMNKSSVFLGTPVDVRPRTSVGLGSEAGFRGLAWSTDGARLFASTAKGFVQEFQYDDGDIEAGARITLNPPGASGNPVPGGLAITRDGSRMFVAAANRNAVVEVDLVKKARVREYPVENLPFEPRLSEDEKTLVVSNWGGRVPRAGDRTGKSQDLDIVVDERGAPASGTVSLIDRASGATRHVEVGIHPTAVVVSGERAYVANAMSDSISEVDIRAGTVA